MLAPAARDELAALEGATLREQWKDKMRRKGYAALVRTQDYRLAIPIVKLASGYFAISLPTVMRAAGKRSNSKSLDRAIQNAREIIMTAAAMAGISDATTVVDPPEGKSRVRRSYSDIPPFPSAVIGPPQQRGLPGKEKPFSWKSEKASERIESEIPELSRQRMAKLVYDAFVRIANMVESPTFTAYRYWVEKYSSCARRSVVAATLDLEKIGLLLITRRRIPGTPANEVNTYTLCTICTRGADLVHGVHERLRATCMAPDAQYAQSLTTEEASEEAEDASSSSVVILDEWLQTEALRACPGWTAEQLREQWGEYVEKGKLPKRGERKPRWAPTRSHFLTQWMPKAEHPEPSPTRSTRPTREPEPADFKAFVAEMYGVGKKPTWAETCDRFPDVKHAFGEWRRNGQVPP